MPQGLLEVKGKLDLSQFWSSGRSDADTAKIVVEDGAFTYRDAGSATAKRTDIFKDAVVYGKAGAPKAAIVKNAVTIRLQGIDAPELHFRPPALLSAAKQSKTQHETYLVWNLEYRQRFGAQAAFRLGEWLRKGRPGVVDCVVRTAVDRPADVFDCYGRLIGDICIDGGKVNVNHWLAKQGWAFPTFYSSMTSQEIQTLTSLAAEARAKKRGIWGQYLDSIPAFDWNLAYPAKGEVLDPNQDFGPAALPKLFRRQATFEVNFRAKMCSGTFAGYLAPKPKEKSLKDPVCLASDFLKKGPTAFAGKDTLANHVKGMKLNVGPEELVFKEDGSDLKTLTGVLIEYWW
jgi:endonuclease YncB( thermonuclease family)